MQWRWRTFPISLDTVSDSLLVKLATNPICSATAPTATLCEHESMHTSITVCSRPGEQGTAQTACMCKLLCAGYPAHQMHQPQGSCH